MELKKTKLARLDYDKVIWEREKFACSRSRVEVVLRLYSLAGILVTGLGFAYFALSTLNIDLSPPQQVGLFLAFGGLAISGASIFILKVRKQYLENYILQIYSAEYLIEFMQTWDQLEHLTKNALHSENIPFNQHSIRQVIDLLRERGILDGPDIVTVEIAMQVRNAILYSEKELPQGVVKDYVDKLSLLLRKLSGSVAERGA